MTWGESSTHSASPKAVFVFGVLGQSFGDSDQLRSQTVVGEWPTNCYQSLQTGLPLHALGYLYNHVSGCLRNMFSFFYIWFWRFGEYLAIQTKYGVRLGENSSQTSTNHYHSQRILNQLDCLWMHWVAFTYIGLPSAYVQLLLIRNWRLGQLFGHLGLSRSPS